MRVLVTGSSGQIGSNLALRLQRDGHDVFGVDKRPNPWSDAFPYLLQDLSMQHVAFDFPPCDVVVHLAAYAKVHELVLHPRRALRAAVPRLPASNVYGRFDNDLHRMVRVLPLFIHRLRRSEPITVYGEHKTLDFTYVGDCVDGIVRGVEAPAAGSVVNETINLAYGRGTPLVGEVTHYVADISKARALLGYEPRVPIEAGIPQAVEWFLERRASHPEEEGLPLADSDSTELAARTYVSDPRA